MFAIIAPKGEKGRADFISRVCKWQPVQGASVVTQIEIHEVKFEQKLLQLSYTPTKKELIKMYLGYLHNRIQQELTTYRATETRSQAARSRVLRSQSGLSMPLVRTRWLRPSGMLSISALCSA